MTTGELLWGGLFLMFIAKRYLIPNSDFRKFIKTKDNSDPPEGRSNLKVLVDHKTGREYLAVGTVFGLTSITPRLPAERQILVFPAAPRVPSHEKPAIQS